MIIHLHWWFIPIAIVLAGFFLAWRMNDGGNGYMPDPFPAIVLVVSLLLAAAICLGHFL